MIKYNKEGMQKKKQPSVMDSKKTELWLKKQGLDTDTPWMDGYAILMVIPEDVRSHFLDSNPELPMPSFAIVRHPTGVEKVETSKGTKYKALLHPFGRREYDTYSVSTTTSAVMPGTTKFRKTGDDDEFVSDAPYIVINEKTKKFWKNWVVSLIGNCYNDHK